MKTINWQQDEPYRHSALVKDYVLEVEQPKWPFKGPWYFTIYGGDGEYRLDDDDIDYGDNDALTADEAKAAAEKALNEYLQTKNQPAI